jgi:tetratricopeptide (TPR) repeat protein
LHDFERFDPQGLEQAASNFQRALELDSSFAAAAYQLASTYDVLGVFGFMSPDIASEKARSAAQLALKLDPNLAAAHAVLGSIYGTYDWDWPAADREFGVAQSLAPSDATISLLAAIQSQIMGRWKEAVNLLAVCLGQDPLNPSGYFVLGRVELRRGHVAEAEAATRRTLEIIPTFSRAHYLLGTILLVRDQSEAALAEMLKEKDDAARFGGTAIAYFALGRKAEADAALVQMLKAHSRQYPFYTAQVFGFRGQEDEALTWLDRAYVQRDSGLPFIKGEPSFKKFEGDPRYKAFLRKMNLPE